MVGLGEGFDEMVEAFRILREHRVQVLTVGQYLRPTEQHLPVDRYWHPNQFEALERGRLRPRASSPPPRAPSSAPPTTRTRAPARSPSRDPQRPRVRRPPWLGDLGLSMEGSTAEWRPRSPVSSGPSRRTSRNVVPHSIQSGPVRLRDVGAALGVVALASARIPSACRDHLVAVLDFAEADDAVRTEAEESSLLRLDAAPWCWRRSRRRSRRTCDREHCGDQFSCLQRFSSFLIACVMTRPTAGLEEEGFRNETARLLATTWPEPRRIRRLELDRLAPPRRAPAGLPGNCVELLLFKWSCRCRKCLVPRRADSSADGSCFLPFCL